MKSEILMVFVMLLLVSCISPATIPLEKQCSVDEDCRTKECCHGKTPVNKENAPDCSGIYCTMGCEEGTTDCGYAELKCLTGSCEMVVLDESV
jgi:hypothetical protein